jgi:hypothetical protein
MGVDPPQYDDAVESVFRALSAQAGRLATKQIHANMDHELTPDTVNRSSLWILASGLAGSAALTVLLTVTMPDLHRFRLDALVRNATVIPMTLLALAFLVAKNTNTFTMPRDVRRLHLVLAILLAFQLPQGVYFGWSASGVVLDSFHFVHFGVMALLGVLIHPFAARTTYSSRIVNSGALAAGGWAFLGLSTAPFYGWPTVYLFWFGFVRDDRRALSSIAAAAPILYSFSTADSSNKTGQVMFIYAAIAVSLLPRFRDNRLFEIFSICALGLLLVAVALGIGKDSRVLNDGLFALGIITTDTRETADVSDEHRIHEYDVTEDVLGDGYIDRIFGLGAGATVDLSGTPRTSAAERDSLRSVNDLHLLTVDSMLKGGLIGVALTAVIVAMILGQSIAGLARRGLQPSGIRLFHLALLAGTIDGLIAANHFWAGSLLPVAFGVSSAQRSALTANKTRSPAAPHHHQESRQTDPKA